MRLRKSDREKPGAINRDPFKKSHQASFVSDFDAQAVDSALRNGITDMRNIDKPGFVSNEEHYSVKLNPGVTKRRLIEFIAGTRPLNDLDAFFKAGEAGLISMRFEGQIPLYHRNPF